MSAWGPTDELPRRSVFAAANASPFPPNSVAAKTPIPRKTRVGERTGRVVQCTSAASVGAKAAQGAGGVSVKGRRG